MQRKVKTQKMYKQDQCQSTDDEDKKEEEGKVASAVY